MVDIMESIFTWNDFLRLLITLFLLYWLLKIIGKIAYKIARKNRLKRIIERVFNQLEIVYIPLSILLIMISFIAINYILHGILFLLVIIISFQHIRRYLDGVFIKISPLVEKGNILKIENFEGEIEQLLPFGMILKVTNGKRFINYTFIGSNGYEVRLKKDDLVYTTLYFPITENSDRILDILFDNPMVNLNQKPTIEIDVQQGVKKLQLTLERGAKINDLLTYLENYKIEITLTKPVI